MRRARLFALTLLAVPLALWTSRAEDKPFGDPDIRPATPASPLDKAWEFQAWVVCDQPELPAFDAGDVKLPGTGRPAVVAVLEAGKDPGEVLRHAAGIARRHEGFGAFYAAPDEATAKLAADAKVEGVKGGVAPAVDKFVAAPVRPALLFVSAAGRVCWAHVPGSHWDPELWAVEARVLVRDAGHGGRPLDVPAPSAKYQGALACAVCHRGEFKDWLMTPHSVALHDLAVIGRDGDAECAACHVAGFGKQGYADRASHRYLADVQCEACHEPQRTHSDNPLGHKDYPAVCADCHKSGFSFFTTDLGKAMEYVAHRQAKGALSIPWSARQSYVTKMKDQMYLETCAKTEYVGTAACRECHAKTHEQWAATRHATAWKTLADANKAAEEKCQRCHTTGFGLPGGFRTEKDTPLLKDVGCESCHGPGKRHVEAKTLEERRTSIFKFDENCPTCVVQRICRTCHDENNDPGFDLSQALRKVRHRDK